MEVRFWGVRGSIAAPGAHTLEFGGNTTCVEVRCGGQQLIFDAGTGLRVLGSHWPAGQALDAHLFFTHTHWDHIQGLPFFGPAFRPGGRLRLYALDQPERDLHHVLDAQMRPPCFPVRLDAFAAQLSFHSIDPAQPLWLGDVCVTSARLNHPDGVLAYRVEHRGRSVVFATDTEPGGGSEQRLRALARGADVLIHDAQYWEREYLGTSGPARIGWGHSCVEHAVAQARACEVGRLILFHHDPERDDAQVQKLEDWARTRFADSEAAREGRTITLSDAVSRSGSGRWLCPA